MTVKSQVVTVGTTATQLSIAPADNAAGSSCAVTNTGTATIYLGGSDVTTANGSPLAAGQSISVDLGTLSIAGNPYTGTHTVDEVLYGVVASGTGTAAVLAVGV